MRVVQPRLSPALMVALPCDECGVEEATVGIDIKHGGGTVRLCGGCLRRALSMLEAHVATASVGGVWVLGVCPVPSAGYTMFVERVTRR